MPEPVPTTSLSAARERAVQALSTYFANDDLSLDELERRIERAYQATNLTELDALTADLRAAVAPPERASERGGGRVPAPVTPEHSRIVSFMGETKRSGIWPVAQETRVVAVMSDMEIDLTQARLPAGAVELRFAGLMTSIKIIVPPGLQVVNDLSVIMSSLTNETDTDDDVPARAGAPVLRLTGTVMMTEVKIVARRREEISG